MKIRKNAYALLYDIVIIAVGIGIAVILSKMGIIEVWVNIFQEYSLVATFIAGIFFTSAFTMAPASIALVHISAHAPSMYVVIWGAFGAMCGDLILFFFIQDRFSKDLKKAFRPSTVKYIVHSFHFGFLKWLSPLIGALIIATPIPDEFGIGLLGMTKMKLYILMPLAFIMNMVGIYALLAFANLIS